jgi:hypothetical protein
MTYTGSSTFDRAELAVIPPCPATDSYYQVAFFAKAKSVYAEEEEVVIYEKKKHKKKKEKSLESKRSCFESQSPRSEHKEHRHSKAGHTLDSKGERSESHEWDNQEEENWRNQKEMKSPGDRRERRARREQRRSSDSNHRGDGNSKTADDEHLDKHPTPYGPRHIPETRIKQSKGVVSFAQAQSKSFRRPDMNVPKTTEVDCDRLLMQLLNAQSEILEGSTASKNASPPELHPLIATSDRDFQKAFDALARDSVIGDNFENSFSEFSQNYLALSPCGNDNSMNDEQDSLQISFASVLQLGLTNSDISKDSRRRSSFNEMPRMPTVQKGVLNAGTLKKTAEKKEDQSGEELVEISRTPFYLAARNK